MPQVSEQQAFSIGETQQVRRQLEALLHDESFRTSRRSVAFLRYIVEQTLLGNGDELKERTIGVNVFGKPLTYDTNNDHVVRTAASELRRRLTVYYSTEEHRNDLRILLLPGSYVPQFRPPSATAAMVVETPAHSPLELSSLPETAASGIHPVPIHAPDPSPQVSEKEAKRAPSSRRIGYWKYVAVLAVLVLGAGGIYFVSAKPTPQDMFWRPLFKGEGPVLISVGEVPGGPPVAASPTDNEALPSLTPPVSKSPTVPFADTVATAQVSGIFARAGKRVVIRRENSSTFADLRDRPTVLIGAFNNDWSLRLTQKLRFSLALDPEKRLLYIRDREHTASRSWSWSTDPHPGERERGSNTPLHDYALISRILDSDTGRDVVVLGGLYTYGTQAAAEFLSDPQLMSLARDIPLDASHHSVQIVLEAQVTEGTPGPPKVVAYHVE